MYSTIFHPYSGQFQFSNDSKPQISLFRRRSDVQLHIMNPHICEFCKKIITLYYIKRD